MRLGGLVFGDTSTPQKWVEAHRKAGFTAAFCPLANDADETTVRAYAQAARAADIVMAEVGVWNNPLDSDKEKAKKALADCRAALALAEKVGARCCVNIAGSRGRQWDGPHEANLTDETFDMIVDTVRAIIDAVKPKRTFYTLEPMPWIYPDSADSYVSLVRAIDRKAFAVHYDPVNMITSPQKYYTNGAMIRDFVAKLAPHIRSCHCKDVILSPKLTTHLDETIPGRGGLDFKTYLTELNRLDRDMPLLVEHVHTPEDCAEGADHVRKVAAEIGVTLR